MARSSARKSLITARRRTQQMSKQNNFTGYEHLDKPVWAPRRVDLKEAKHDAPRDL